MTNVLRGSGPYTLTITTTESGGSGAAGDGGSDGSPTVKRWIEAEAVNESPAFEPFVVAADDTASGGAYVHVTDGPDEPPTEPPEEGRARYEFDVPTADTYAVWGRVRPASDGGDSFYAWIDDGAPVRWKAADEDGWKWARLTGGRGIAPVAPRLDAGEHALTVARLDDGVDLDRLLVTNDESFTPSGPSGEGDGTGSGDGGGSGDGDSGAADGSGDDVRASAAADVVQSPKDGNPTRSRHGSRPSGSTRAARTSPTATPTPATPAARTARRMPTLRPPRRRAAVTASAGSKTGSGPNTPPSSTAARTTSASGSRATPAIAASG